MLEEAGLGKRYWGEAVSIAIYLKNRSPTSALNNKIPEEIWPGKRIDLSHLRVFGSKAYAHIRDVKRNKLDAKSKALIMVGYCEYRKGYLLVDPQNPGKIIKSRDVIFFEGLS